VRELRQQGKLGADAPVPPQGKASQFVDIDAELLQHMAPHVEEEAEHTAYEEHEEEPDQGAAFAEEPHGHGLAMPQEPTTPATEEELRDRVRRSIEDLVSGAAPGEAQAQSAMTPAQLFYLENRDKLVDRAQEYYLQKHRETNLQEGEDPDMEDEWRFYHDPVVRPPKGHLWATGLEEDGEEYGMDQGWLEVANTWPKGQLPTPDMIADLLRKEQAMDVRITDLRACGRHDVGTYGIVGTGVTTRHCRRMGDIISRATQSCAVPHVEAFCYGTREDEWVVAHCGSIKVHLFTREARELYQLEVLWHRPDEFFQPGDFPHYYEVYGTATEALMGAGTHATLPGTRSRAAIPPPYNDSMHDALMIPDYEAAEDAKFSTPSREIGFDDPASSHSAPAPGHPDFEDDHVANSSHRPPSPQEASPRTGAPVDLDAEADTDSEGEETWPSGVKVDGSEQSRRSATPLWPSTEVDAPAEQSSRGEEGTRPQQEPEPKLDPAEEPWRRL